MWSEGSPLVWLSSRAGSPTSSNKCKCITTANKKLVAKLSFGLDFQTHFMMRRKGSRRVIIMRTLQCKRIFTTNFHKATMSMINSPHSRCYLQQGHRHSEWIPNHLWKRLIELFGFSFSPLSNVMGQEILFSWLHPSLTMTRIIAITIIVSINIIINILTTWLHLSSTLVKTSGLGSLSSSMYETPTLVLSQDYGTNICG